MAVPDVFYGGLSNSLHAAQLREVGRRRIIVQMENGNVLGLELDRSEKVQSVKKKVQAALCIPTEQSALFFGDHVVEDDLSEVRNDTPLLLTKGLHRSSSLPCMSPTLDLSPPKDWSQPVELVGTSDCGATMKQLIHDSVEALESGVEPVLATGGLGGAYYFKNLDGNNIAIVKPTDEEPFAPNNPKGFVGRVLGEPGLKRAIRVGETGIREVAAYLLDHDHFARVPATSLVKVRHSAFNVNNKDMAVNYQNEQGSPVSKIASFQQFVKHDSDASDIGTSRFSVSAVHRIGILDVRIFNTDRHGGNILVRKLTDERGWMGGDSFELIPIDHGLCLPETIDDPYFEWLHWPQASMPFTEEELNYINGLDPYADAEMLRKELPMLREGCLRMLILCTVFLQNAARSGLNLAEIGAMMSREICAAGESVSELEKVCILAKLQMESTVVVEEEEQEEGEDEDTDDAASSSTESSNSSSVVENSFSIDMDDELLEEPEEQVLASAEGNKKSSNGNNKNDAAGLLSGRILDELLEQNEGRSEFLGTNMMAKALRPFGGTKYSKKSHSNRYERSFNLRRFFSARAVSSPDNNSSDKNSGSKKDTALAFSSMSEDEWDKFMYAFEGLLEDAFAKRKIENLNFVQRLGTSCQF